MSFDPFNPSTMDDAALARFGRSCSAALAATASRVLQYDDNRYPPGTKFEDRVLKFGGENMLNQYRTALVHLDRVLQEARKRYPVAAEYPVHDTLFLLEQKGSRNGHRRKHS